MNLPENKTEAEILNQIRVEYNFAYQYMNPKRLQNLDRMRLYSNQTRDKSLVGETLVFTVFQTVFSKLYEDSLSVKFSPGHKDDVNKVQSLSPIARYDYGQMDKDQIDYDWDWYTCFWGAGFLDVSEWDPDEKIMRPSVIDNATFLLDPNCTLINGDKRGFGKARFWGREIAKTKFDMSNEGYENYETLAGSNDYSSLAYQDKQARATAQNLGSDVSPTGYDNDYLPLLEWATTVDGKKYIFTSDLKFTKLCKAKEWKQDKWPIIHRKLFPIPGDPFGVSVPDLVEDKHRARSVLMNLGLLDAKSSLYPMYVYDRNAISPTTDLSIGFNKWIPSDGPVNGAVQNLPKQPIGQIVSYIMDVLDQAAQKATAASSMQQGVQSEKPRSANEVVRVFNSSEERISTSAKVFGWSEREFWRFWLEMYEEYFKSAHEKFVRIEGAFGPKFEQITGDIFDFAKDPDIYIESKVLNDAQSQEEVNRTTAFNNLVAQDQSVNRRYLNRRNARIVGGMNQEEIDRLYPPTIDEMKAEDENLSLNKNKLVKIDINDDHLAHLLIHANADTTKATIVHVEAHKRAMMIKRDMAQAPAQVPGNPAEATMSAQVQPNLAGTGSAPAARASTPNSVQQ